MTNTNRKEEIKAIREKWRATVSNEVQRTRFDLLVDGFESSSPAEQERTGNIAAAMAVSGGPMSPVDAAYLNFTIDATHLALPHV